MERLSERLTYMHKDGYGVLKDFMDPGWAITKLAAYEDTNLTPDQAQELAAAQAEGRLVVLPEDYKMDMGDALESIKVVSALRSECPFCGGEIERRSNELADGFCCLNVECGAVITFAGFNDHGAVDIVKAFNRRVKDAELQRIEEWRDNIRLRIANEMEALVDDNDPEEVQAKAYKAYTVACKYLFSEAAEWGEDETRCGKNDRDYSLLFDAQDMARRMLLTLEAARRDGGSEGAWGARMALEVHEGLLRQLTMEEV